ncbi:MAG: hypothetical protein LR015_06620 [Verrucomicrobia bacterium]|nr:hypothetical protein [Verrucomicrobiota bacterium]
MKVWLASPESIHSRSGSVALRLHYLAEALVAGGAAVSLIVPKSTSGEELLKASYTLLEFDPEPVASLAPSLSLSWRLAEFIFQLAADGDVPDIIEIPDSGALGYFVLQWRQLRSPLLQTVPIIIHLSRPESVMRGYNQDNRFRGMRHFVDEMEQETTYAADALLADSYSVAHEVRTLMRIRELPVSMVPPPMPAPVGLTREIKDSNHLLVPIDISCGSALDPLLRSCRQLWASGLNFKLTIVGKDSVYEPVGTLYSEYLRSRFADEIDGGVLSILPENRISAVQAMIQKASLIICPELWGPVSFAFLFAVAANRPVLASRTAAYGDLFEDERCTKRFFSWYEEGEFTAKLRAILAQNPAEQLRDSDTLAGKVTQVCSIPRAAATRLDFYHELRRKWRPTRWFRSLGQKRLDRPLPSSLARKGRGHGTTVAILATVQPAAYNDALKSVLDSNGAEDFQLLIAPIARELPSWKAWLHQIGLANDQRLRLVERPDQGTIAGQKFIAEQATGETLLFLSPELQLNPSFLTVANSLLSTYSNLAAVSAWHRLQGAVNGLLPVWNWHLPHLLLPYSTSPVWLLRRAAFLQFGFHREELYHGMDIQASLIAMAEAGYAGASIPAVLIRYTVSSEKTAPLSSSAALAQAAYQVDRIVEYHPHLFKMFGDNLMQLLYSNGPEFSWLQPGSADPFEGRLL